MEPNIDLQTLLSFGETLRWIAGGAGALALALLLAPLLEKWKAYQAISPVAKQWVAYLISGLIGLSAYLILKFVPATVLEAIAEYWGVFVLPFGSILATQGAHAIQKVLAARLVGKSDDV